MNVIPPDLAFSVGPDTFTVRRSVRGMVVRVEDSRGRWRAIAVLRGKRVAEQGEVLGAIAAWQVEEVLGS